jgi:hypothetical protein
MSGQISFTISLVTIALFALAILSFAINFGIDNNSAVLLTDDTELSNLATNTKTNFSTFKEDTEKGYLSIVTSVAEPGSDSIKSPDTFKITWSNVFGITKNIMKVGYEKIFGGGEGFGIFITTFISMILFIMTLYLIKTWKGNP